MALINCPECGKQVSDQAQTCIHCGFPLMRAVDVLDADSDAKRKKICIESERYADNAHARSEYNSILGSRSTFLPINSPDQRHIIGKFSVAFSPDVTVYSYICRDDSGKYCQVYGSGNVGDVDAGTLELVMALMNR